MGVRGLTSYIARHAEKYLQPFELHDTDLVIDGDNLACLLYKDVSGCNSAFGGDYDEYYRTVVCFFDLLFECKVRPFVLMDGGYERKKMRTVEKRLRGKIHIVKHLNPNMSKPLFPLMMKEVFVDAIRDCGLKVMRCTFEADDELAVLARKLNCPVLSYDSDFYIYNVQYIPAVTLTMKAHIKKEKDLLKNTHLRHCQARRFMKITKANKGQKILPENPRKINNKAGQKNVKYIDCCIYRIENLLAGTKLKREMLPIFAALLGNDYISSRAFKQFHLHVGKKGSKSPIHRRIQATILWLRNESKESALEKIFGRMKKDQREPLLAQMEAATCGYSNEISDAYEYFGLHLEEREIIEEFEPSDEEIDDKELSESELDLSEVNTEEDPEADVEDISDEDEEKSEEISEDELESPNELDGEEEIQDENTEEQVEIVTEFPEWLRDRIRSADLPRFCIDLVHQNLYINNPQVENFLLPDCNMIALPIIRHIFTLLKYQYPEKPQLRYLSRVIKKTNVLYSRLNALEAIPPFDPTEKSLDALKNVFSRLPLSTEKLFADLNSIPAFLQLYILAIVYWANKTAHADEIHLCSLLLCLVVVSTIDAKIVPVRDAALFSKKYGQIIRKERLRLAVLTATKINTIKGAVPTLAQLKAEKIENLMNSMSPEKRIQYASKTECILVQDCLLKYFQQPNFNHKHHDEFSSSVVHGFSEFQSVIFQLYTLNKIVNEPLESIRMARVYSGVFLYNLYVSFRMRPDVDYYVEKFLLKDSPVMFAFYKYLQDWLKPFVPLLKADKPKKATRKLRKHKSNENKPLAKESENVFTLLEEQI